MADTDLQKLEKIKASGGLNPIQQSEYDKLRREQGSSNTNIGGYQPPDPIETARKLREFNIASNQPAISSLQSSIPETEQKFATEQARLTGEKEPLKQRYQSIINELKGRETTQTREAQITSAREFGRRGIPLSSTAYGDFLGERVNPIGQFYGSEIAKTGISQEDALRQLDNLIAGLPAQSTEAKRAILNAIASLQTGDPSSAITGALGITQQQQQANQFAQQLALQQQTAADENAYRNAQLELSRQPQQQNQFATLGEGSTLYDLLNRTALYTAPKSYKSAVGGGSGANYYGSSGTGWSIVS